ncbi:MAG TPA: TatD family hydrolase [Fimbriimonas sp.]
MLIDTHCHLHDVESFPDPGEEIRKAREAGVERIVVVGVQPSDWTAAVALADRHEEVYAVVGWHPNYTAAYERGSLEGLAEFLRHPKVLALGEIGLDYHWDYAPPSIQRQALDDQLELARDLSVPVVFHAREAYSDLLDALEAFGPHPFLLHCFAGEEEDARRGAALGCYFGIDGPLTYKKADDLRRIVGTLPRDRVVLETDSPYMAPVPFRGKKNTPAYVACVNQALARLWSVPAETSAQVTTENAIRFFGERLRTRCR